MVVLKQIVVTIVVLLLAAALWVSFDARPGRYLLTSDLALPAPVRALVVSLAPDEASKPLPAEGRAAPPGAAAGRGGRGGRGGGPTVVVAGSVETSLTRSQMRAIGTGEAERSVTVYPDVTGIIENVPFQSGDQVETGSVLAVLQKETEQLAVDRARIALAAAEERLGRFQRLRDARTITTVEVGDVERELQNARLDLRGAEVALGKRTIVAPIAGRVGIVAVDTGDLVNNQSVIATVDDRSQLKVIFYTTESFVQELRIGGPIEATSTARPDRTYTGRITAIDSRLDEASRTLRTEATIDNPQDELRPGMSFAMSLALEGELQLSVDPLAVQWERSGPIVWKIDGEDVRKTKVRIIERNIDRVLVASEDLKEGDRVVVEGLQSVREGGKVEVQNPLPAAPPAGPVPPAEAPPKSEPPQPGASVRSTPPQSGAAQAAQMTEDRRRPDTGGASAQ